MSTVIADPTDQERIEHAARWLDEEYPGWHEKINVDTLDVADSANCIGAQIGVNWHDLHDRYDEQSPFVRDAEFAWYTHEWIDEILARRAA